MTEETTQQEAPKAAAKKPAKKANSKTENNSRATEAKKPANRPARVAMVAGAKLTIPSDFQNDDKNHYRWFADDAGRINQAEAAYYEKVADEKGNVIMRKGPVDMYLMRLPMKYRIEDLELKKQAVKGKMIEEQKLGDGEYVPEGRKHAIQKEDIDPLSQDSEEVDSLQQKSLKRCFIALY